MLQIFFSFLFQRLLHPFIDEVWEGVEENQSSEEQKRRYEEDHEESAQKASVFTTSAAESEEGDADKNDGADDEPSERLLDIPNQIFLQRLVPDFRKPILFEDFLSLNDAPKTETNGNQTNNEEHEVIEDEYQLHELRPTARQQRHLDDGRKGGKNGEMEWRKYVIRLAKRQ